VGVVRRPHRGYSGPHERLGFVLSFASAALTAVVLAWFPSSSEAVDYDCSNFSSGLTVSREKLVVVSATAYRATHRSQDPEDHAKYNQDDADCPEEADVEDGGKYETDDSENDHLCLQWTGLVERPSTL
jgi:hypothetical protein